MVTTTATNVSFPHLSPTTALGWLTAIGVFKLSGANGYWEDDNLKLEIESSEILVQEFLQNYRPKPWMSPWNSKSIINKRSELDKILNSTSERFALMRQGYQKILNALESIDAAKLSSAQKKLVMMPELQQVDDDYFQQWLNAVGILVNTKSGAAFKPNYLLGTGGNLIGTEFCTEYQAICTKLWDLETGEPTPDAEKLVRAAILGESCPQTLNLHPILGHTFPAADFFNDLAPSSSSQSDYCGNGEGSTQLANPVDLILYLEGAVTFSGTLDVKGLEDEDSQEYTLAYYPLLLEVNSGSANTSDLTGRTNEVWLPLWDEPMDAEEFQDLATSYLSFRLKNQVIDTLDMLDRITKLGESLGIQRFSRFGLWTRKGKGNYLIHIGIVTPNAKDIGSELGIWRFQARPTDQQSKAQYALLTNIHKSFYLLRQGNDEAMTMIRLLGQLELLHSQTHPKSIPPCPQLDEQWITAVYEEYPSFEVELAAALASTSLAHRDAKKEKSIYSFRRILSSARYAKAKDDKPGRFFWSDDHNNRLKTSSLRALCLSLLKLWSEDLNRHPAFGSNYWASPDAISAFIAGKTDDQLILDLTIGFALCQPAKRLPRSHYSSPNKLPIPDAYKRAASIQWNRDTTLSIQSINGLLYGSTAPLSRQLTALQKPAVLPREIAIGERCALALVFPVDPALF